MIVFGFKRFYDFIYGGKIVLRTDHKPLEFILGLKKCIPITDASRLQRWCYYLSRFQYEIEHIKWKNNGNCGALSRLPIDDELDIFDSEFSPLYYVSNCVKSIDYSDIALKIKSDSVLNSIVKYTLFGWSENASKLSDDEKKDFAKRFEISFENNCLLWGYRIPAALRFELLTELHASHMDIVKI